MSNEEKVYKNLIKSNLEHLKSITDLSVSQNQSGRKNFIECNFKGFDFDFQKNDGKLEKSPDALFYNNETLFFVEFKSGRPIICKEKKKAFRMELRSKIHEGLATLHFFMRTGKKQKIFNLIKSNFCNLKIEYIIILREPKVSSFSITFKDKNINSCTTNEEKITKYYLGNLKDHLLQDVQILSVPENILKFFHKKIDNSITEITYHDEDQNYKKYSIKK